MLGVSTGRRYFGSLYRIDGKRLVKEGADRPPPEPGPWWFVLRGVIVATGHKLWTGRVGQPWCPEQICKTHKVHES